MKYINEISDEFKIDILRSIRSLILRASKKYKIILNFLSNCLKVEGGLDFKRNVVESIEKVYT
jgi:coatomer subunit gamma